MERLRLFLKPGILLFGVTLVIVVVFLFLVISSFTQQPEPSPIEEGSIPTSSPQRKQELQIVTVSPSENATNVGLFEPIQISFSRSFTETEQQRIRVALNPEAGGEQRWSSPNTLLFTPDEPYKNSQTYTATLSSPGSSYLWQFTIAAVEDVSLEDQIRIQSQGDLEYGEKIEEIYITYPWYDNFPLHTDEYFVYFDVDLKRFTAKLYPTAPSGPARDQEVASLQAEITQQITNLGINTETYPISWQVN